MQSSAKPCLALGKKKKQKNSQVALWHVASSRIRDRTWVSFIVRCILYHWATREAPEFFFFLSLLVLIGVQCYFTVVVISNFQCIWFLSIFDMFTICMFSLARCSDLYFVPGFLVLFKYNPLSDMYFVNVFLCLWFVFRFSEQGLLQSLNF